MSGTTAFTNNPAQLPRWTNVVSPPPQPPGSKLKLKLTGVLAYAFADKAIAIISNGSNEQSAYGIGDTPVDGVTLQQVYKHYVVINNHSTE